MGTVEAVLVLSREVFDIDEAIAACSKDLTRLQEKLRELQDQRDAKVNALGLLVVPSNRARQPQVVRQFLERNRGDAFSSEELSEKLNMNPNSVRGVLSKLMRDGLVVSAGRGFYTAAGPNRTELPPVKEEDEALNRKEAAQAEEMDMPF